MFQTSTLFKFFSRKNTARLLLLLLCCLFGVVESYAQATLPTKWEGPWQTGLPSGWSQSGLGLDKTTEIGSSTKGGTATFDSAGDFIEINYNDVAGQVGFDFRADGGRNYKGLTFEVYEKAEGAASYPSTPTGQIVNPAGAVVNKYIFNIAPTSRTVKLVLTSVTGTSVAVDGVIVAKAVPKINIHQGGNDIQTGSTYSYGRFALGDQSQAIVFTIENSGTADLTLTDPSVITVAGTNPEDFIVDFSATATTIAPGSSTTFTVMFKPVDVGAKSAKIVIANNDAEINPYEFNVTGESVYCPVINRLDIYEGKAGDYVYIIGSNLDRTTRVTFGGVDASFYILNADTIDVTVPTGALTGPVEVFTAECSAQSATFTVLGPTISLSKSTMSMTASVGSSVVDQYQVSAEYLDEGASVTVNVDGTLGPVSISRDGISYSQSITFTAAEIKDFTTAAGATYNTLPVTSLYVKYEPADVANHTINISHTSTGAVTQNLVVNGVATAPPVCGLVIDRLDIYEGKVGDYVYIIGSGLDQVSRVTFGGVDATFYIVSGDTIDVTVPTGALTGPVEVFSAECSAQSATFTVLGAKIFLSATSMSFNYVNIGGEYVKEYQVSAQGLNDGAGVSLGMTGGVGVYTISLSPTDGFARTINITNGIIDNSLEPTYIYVKYAPTSEGTHTATISHSSPDANTEVMSISGDAVTPLPVELMSFNAALQNNNVLLTWATASEENSSRFEVEMSKNPKSGFEKIGSVDSKVTNSVLRTSYEFLHKLSNETGTIYYRLKQVDLDGTADYSKVVSINVKSQVALQQLMVAPNPINFNSRLFVSAEVSGKANLTMHSMAGQKVYTKVVELEQGRNEVQLPVYDKLTKGMYVLTVEQNGQVSQIKVIKE